MSGGAGEPGGAVGNAWHFATVASATISNQRFPVGATVSAFPKGNWGAWITQPSGDPVGSPVASATVGSSGAATISGLSDETDYWLHCDVSGDDRYVAYSTRTNPNNPRGGAGITNGEARLVSVESRSPTIEFTAPGPPGSDGTHAGQWAWGYDANDQPVEGWRWSGSNWVKRIGAAPSLEVSLAATQSLSNNTNTTIDIDTLSEAVGFTVDLSANTITVQRPGWYLWSLSAIWPSNATGYRRIALITDAFKLLVTDRRGATATAGVEQAPSQLQRLPQGAIVYPSAQHTGGTSLALGPYSVRAIWMGA